MALMLAAVAVRAGAQTSSGAISGKVVNPASGLSVPNVTVTVVGSENSTTTGLDGSFLLRDVLPGSRDVVASRDGYQSSTIAGVSVKADELTRLDIPLSVLSEKVVVMESFKVAADIVESSDIGLLAARQKAVALSDAIGSEQFGRLAVGNAAEALSKVTGASLVDGKYVLIRGLGDRYSNTLMNGVSVPSADPDKRAVQMDQFPSDLVESITTTKSFTPDQPGAFSGGSVNLKTKSFPEQFFASFSASVEYNSAVTGEPLLRTKNAGATAPSLSSSLPSRTLAEISARQGNFAPAEELDRATRAFPGEVIYPHTEKAKPDVGFSAAVGNRHAFGEEGLFGYTASVTFDRSYSHSESGEANRFIGTASAPQPRILLTSDASLLSFGRQALVAGTPPLGVTSSTFSESLGLFTKLALRPSIDHEVSLDLFVNESTDDTVRRGVGEEANNYTGSVFEVYDLLYTERSVESFQLAGKSLFPRPWRVAGGLAGLPCRPAPRINPTTARSPPSTSPTVPLSTRREYSPTASFANSRKTRPRPDWTSRCHSPRAGASIASRPEPSMRRTSAIT
jgi:hypothetical protein